MERAEPGAHVPPRWHGCACARAWDAEKKTGAHEPRPRPARGRERARHRRSAHTHTNTTYPGVDAVAGPAQASAATPTRRTGSIKVFFNKKCHQKFPYYIIAEQPVTINGPVVGEYNMRGTRRQPPLLTLAALNTAPSLSWPKSRPRMSPLRVAHTANSLAFPCSTRLQLRNHWGPRARESMGTRQNYRSAGLSWRSERH